MIRRWYHKVSTDWLKARRNVITATEIAKLVPEYARSQKANAPAIMPGFASLWAEKNTDVEPDPSAVGPAARGHICEPWAVKAWNQQGMKEMHHWDDVLIINDGIGFSPDALDVPCLDEEAVTFNVIDTGMVSDSGVQQDQPWNLLEIKSYDPAHHMKCCLKGKLQQDELMQIAVPFIVCPKLVKVTLVFFCPGAPISMKAFSYTRGELEPQMDLAKKIIGLWKDTVAKCDELVGNEPLNAVFTEDEIWEQYQLENITDEVALENVFLLRR